MKFSVRCGLEGIESFFVALAVCLILSLAPGSEARGQSAANAPALPLPASGVLSDLKSAARYRPDPDSSLSARELLESDAGFRPFDPALDQQAPPLWLKLELMAPPDASGSYSLRVGRRMFTRFDLYTAGPDGNPIRRSASASEAIDAEVAGREFVFPINVAPGERETLLIHVELVQNSLQPLVLSIQDQASFVQGRIEAFLAFGLIFGILIALIFHNFVLYLNLRQPGHLYYVLAMSATVILLGIDSGLLQNFLLPAFLEAWTSHLFLLSSSAMMIAISLFFRAFVDGPQNAPGVTRVVMALLPIIGLIAVAQFFVSTQGFLWLAMTFQVLHLVVMSLLLIGGFQAARRGSIEGAIFLAAWSMYFISGIARTLLTLDLIGSTPLLEYLMYVAAVFEASVLALGLSFQVRQLYERHATAMQEQHHAAMLANTDPLTGAYNRRFLQSFLGNALKSDETDRFDRSVLILDLDEFKQANDSFGHAAGDLILRQLVRRCRRIMDEDDVICRLGGDEFVIITNDRSDRDGLSLANRLTDRFRKQPFEFEGLVMPVTVSIGVVSAVSKQCTVSDVLRMADQALYQAKQAGRSRAVLFDPDVATPFRHGPSMEAARERTE
jgi:diguanylate cyclase (GGDEF)-like protein